MATNEVAMKNHSGQVKAASGINVILGIWLIISPWVYGYAATARGTAWNSIFVGILVLIFGSMRYQSPHAHVNLSWANIVLGAWTVLSPWIYAYTDSSGPLLNSVIVGFAVLVLAIWSGSATVTEHRHRAA